MIYHSRCDEEEDIVGNEKVQIVVVVYRRSMHGEADDEE